MRKLKVFLSKSKAGDFDTQVLTKNILLEAGMEICEYVGGDYSPDLMLSCDILLMVPSKMRYDSSYCCTLGKGQFNEIDNWILSKDVNNIFIVTSRYLNILTISPFDEKELFDEKDWKVNYAKVFTKNRDINSITVSNLLFNTTLDLDNFYLNRILAEKGEYFKNLKNPCAEVIVRGECTLLIDTSGSMNFGRVNKQNHLGALINTNKGKTGTIQQEVDRPMWVEPAPMKSSDWVNPVKPMLACYAKIKR